MFEIILPAFVRPCQLKIPFGITILGLGVMIAGLGILVGIPRFIPLYIHEKKYNLLQGYVHFIFVTIFVSSITVGFVLWVSASYITSFFDFPESLTFFLKIIAVLVPIKEFQEMEEFLDQIEDTVLGYIAQERNKKTSLKDYIPLSEMEKRVGLKR